MPDKVSPLEFAESVKKKYPEYRDYDNIELTNAIIKKYPEYKDYVNMSSPLPVGPVAPAQTPVQGIPTFQEQMPTMQANRFDEAVSKDKKKSGSYIGALYDSFVSAVDPLMYIGDEAFLGAYQYMSGKKLAPQEKQAIRKAVSTTMEVAGARPRKTQDEGVVEGIQGGWDLSDGFGSKDLKALGLMGSRVAGDLAIAAASTAVGVPPGSTYFAQGYGSGLQDYNDMVAKGSLEENGLAKQTYALTVGTINGLLEKLAFDKIFGKGPAFDAVKKRVTADVLKQVAKSNTKVTMDVVEKVGEQMLKKELSSLGKRGARAGYAAGVESLTEGTQAGLEDAAKLLTNAVQGQQVFDENDIKKNFVKNVLNSAAAGFALGAPMGIASTMMSNVDNTLVKEIAKAKDETELNSVISELEESMTKSNASEEEIDAMRQSAIKYNSIKQTIPPTVSDEAKSNIISLIDRRNGIDEKMTNWQAELETVDESMKPDVESEMTTLVDAKELINDEIRENAAGGKFTYIEDNGKYFKQFEGEDPIEIKKSTYELKKSIEDATKKGQGPIQEGGAVSDISQRQGTQEGGAQKAPAQADSRYRNISSEETVGIPTLLGSKVTYKVGNRKITGTLIQEGQTLSVENETGDVVAELGNIDELSSMSPEQMNLTVIESRVEPTEQGFSVDGKELFNENENPFDAVSVDKNGNVMNVVLTTTGGKRRKFRGRVAQDLAAQIIQKEDQKAQQADQRLQQEFALPTPTAPKKITTQPTIARVTEDNVSDLDNVKGTPLQKKVLNDAKRVVTAIGAAVRNITGSPVSVNVHDQNSYTAAVLEAGGTEEDAKSRGFYMADDGSIHLNMDNIDSDTMLHEGFHPILDALERFNPAVINDLFTQLESIPEASEIISKAKRTYTGDVTQKKEAITDFVAAVADGRVVLNPSNFQKIKKFIQDMLQKLGIGQPNVSFMKVDNEQDLIKLANFVTEKFRTGESITLEGLEGTVEKQLDGIEEDLTGYKQYDSSEGQDIDGTVPEEGTGRGPQFSKSTLANARKNVKKISELVGLKISRVVFYDMTRVGKLSIKNIKTGYTPDIEGKGGPLYSYMDDSVDNQAVLAFVSINQAIQSLQRQQMFPDAAHAVASQNPLTAHLGNKSTLRALFGDGVGIFQNAAKTKAQEKEIVNVLLSEIDRMSKMPADAEAKKSLDKILPKVDLKSIKTINDFRDKILLGEGDSFGKRGSILGELLQNKQSKVTAATRQSHKILHYKYGIPTIEDIAKGNNQEELGNVELGDVVKFVRPSTEPVIYTTDPAMYELYSKKPTPAMKEGGIRIELLPEASSHESYPFVLVGENVALLEEYVGAQQLYEKYKGMKKSGTFFKLGRMKKDAEAGQVAAETPTEAKGPAFQRVAPNGQPSKLNAKQYEQVRTPEFKNWFGDWEANPESASKAVDENGEPLVLFHGTKAKFDQFEYNKMSWESRLSQQGPGFYMTDNKKAASQYGKPMNVFTSVKNPLVIDNRSSNITKEQAYKLFSNGDNKWFYESYLPFYTKSEGLSKEQLVKKYVDDMSGVRGFDKEVLQNIKRSYNQDKSYDKMMSDVAGILGKDGVIEKVSDGLSVYVAFTPNQIKSATENIGTFSTQDDRIQFQKIDREIINGFYSPIEDRVSTFKQPKASVQKWKEIVGVKSDEAVFSGLSDWLNSMKPERQLPKEEVVQFIKDNRITIEEIQIDDSNPYEKEKQRLLNKYNTTSFAELMQLATSEEKDNLYKQEGVSKPTKFYQYQLPGGQNYKEVLITLPGKEQFKSSHFDETNIITHLRMNTRTDLDGRKVLFLEEVQSDWGQKGKKEGFGLTDKDKSRLKELGYDYKDGKVGVYIGDNFVPRNYNDLVGEAAQIARKSQLGVSTAPYVTNTNAWVKLGLKVALKEAARQGADIIAWTTGQQQNERYDLSKQVDEITYKSLGDGAYRIVTYKDGIARDRQDIPENKLEDSFGKDVADRIINNVGDKNESTGVTSLSGLNLSVGGKGMNAFYGDTKNTGIVGNVAKALVKELTGKDGEIRATKIKSSYDTEVVGDTDDIKRLSKAGYTFIYNGNPVSKQRAYELIEDGQIINAGIDSEFTQPSIELTTELKQSVQSGMPQFQRVTPTKETRKPVKVAGRTIISSKAKAKIDNLFTSSGPLGPAIRTFKEQMGGELTAEVNIAERTTKEAMKLMEKYKGIITTQDIENFLSGKATPSAFPLDLATKLTEMRVHVDRLTDRLLDLNVIEDKDTRQLYMDNKGKYLLRSYELFRAKGPVTVENVTKKLKNVDQSTVDAALAFLEQQIAADNPNLTPQELKEKAISMANSFLSDEDMAFGGRPIDGSVNTKSISRRSQYLEDSPAIRALMGEYTDPMYKYYSSIFKLANIASHRAYLNNLKKEGMGKFLFTEPTGEATIEIAGEGTKALAPLGGLYTFPEIKEALMVAEREKKNLLEFLAGHVRIMKTVYNPATHVKNLLGSLAFAVSNGHWMYLGKALSYIKKSNRKELIELIDILNREGVLNNNIGVGEINQYFDKFESVNDILASINNNANSKTTAAIYGKAKANLKKIPNAMKKAYALEDDIFKILGFVNETNLYARAEYKKDFDALNPDEKAKVIKEAAERVKSFYPTFSRVPKFVKGASKAFFLGNFLSFPVESVRVSYNTISQGVKEARSSNPKIRAIGINRLAGTLLYNGAMTWLLTYASMAAGQGLSGVLGYIFDDEEEIEKRDKAKKFRAPWNKDSQVLVNKFSDGKLVYSDMGSIDSYGYQREVWNTFWDNMSDKKGFNEAMARTIVKTVEPFLELDMTVATIANLMDGKDEFGNEIANSEAPYDERLKGYTKYISSKFSPGVINSMFKAYRLSQEGDDEAVINEALSQLVRTYTVDLEKSFTNYVYANPGEKNTGETGFKKRLDNAESIYNKVKNSKSMSDSEKETYYQMAVEAYKNVLRDVNGYYEAAIAGGVDANKLNQILMRSKLADQRSLPELVSIIQNRYDLPDEIYIRR